MDGRLAQPSGHASLKPSLSCLVVAMQAWAGDAQGACGSASSIPPESRVLGISGPAQVEVEAAVRDLEGWHAARG